MIKQIFAIMIVAASAAAAAQSDVTIGREVYGSGTPGSQGIENADHVENNIYHAPQYLPAFPTAGTIWPRVVEVPCVRNADQTLKCQGYNWTPKMGRGEYLFFKPVIAEPAVPSVIERERVIIKEVPRKPIKQ